MKYVGVPDAKIRLYLKQTNKQKTFKQISGYTITDKEETVRVI